jgi:hypothetical protein
MRTTLVGELEKLSLMAQENEASNERQDNGQWGHQADPGAGGRKASRRVSHQIPEIE